MMLKLKLGHVIMCVTYYSTDSSFISMVNSDMHSEDAEIMISV